MEHAALSCIQCGHVWHPLYPHRKPRICPKCKSQNWEKPKEVQTPPVVEVIDPPTAVSSEPGISNEELVEEIKDLRKQVEQLKAKLEQVDKLKVKLEQLEKLCNSGMYIKTL